MYTLAEAQELDRQNPTLRHEFIIPSRADLKIGTSSTTNGTNGTNGTQHDNSTTNGHTPSSSVPQRDESTYLCGNSLGLQPRCLSHYLNSQLQKWSHQGVYGHFKPGHYPNDSPIPPWLDLDDAVKTSMSNIVGAQRSEIAVMGTLTSNLHMAMASFYRPVKNADGTGRYKIIMESKAFPSDHFAVESQIRHHNLDVSDAMVLIDPPSPKSSPLIPTEEIERVILQHKDTAAILWLPGIQFYTGQVFRMQHLTQFAHSHGLIVGWDLAHCAGNIPLCLHDWDVDFAVWCNYKYVNSGPGAIGGLFVHERYSSSSSPSTTSESSNSSSKSQNPHGRFEGWWGSSKDSRFRMDNIFDSIPGAAGWQVSNPSAMDLCAVLASLSVFDKTSMSALRARSIKLTTYLLSLLESGPDAHKPYKIITPGIRDRTDECGAQLSVALESPELLEKVMEALEEEGVVVDERKPDVVRIAPAPLYNGFEDCWRCVEVLRRACGVEVESLGVK